MKQWRLQATVDMVLSQLGDFVGYVEISNFEDFFLFSMGSEGGPEGVMSMLGVGGSKDIILNYDPVANMYYSRVMSGPQDSNSIMVYTRDNPIADQWEDLTKKFHVETKDKILENIFSPNLREALTSQKTAVLFLQSSDVSGSTRRINDPMSQLRSRLFTTI